ncbi:MAG: endonuclease/exonuclease/phosphatase family protein [Calditrichaceae bacterium]|nr:endonuclease/exonuclease/phosphatase family protein [Calditrichaceae bacterium]
MYIRFRITVLFICLLSIIYFIISCEPLVSTFDKEEDAVMYKSGSRQAFPDQVTRIKAMTWNIRFGAGRIPWFGDSCGDRVILSEKEVKQNLQAIAAFIDSVQPDILFINEIDIESKRTSYIDQVQWLLNHTYFNYGAFASNWKSQFIPSDGLGRMNMGNAILSRWKISDAVRIKLPLRGDQDALTEYFYLRRNILKCRIELPGLDNFYAVTIHLAAFSTDDTKQKQIDVLVENLEKIDSENGIFLLGGDFNLLPPNATKTDYCLEDMCDNESFHQPGDNPQHKEGSYFTPEITWLQPMYNYYQPAVPMDKYISDEVHFFTHTPDRNGFWNRKIDYLFTNDQWILNSDSTYQNTFELSDHTPVSAEWELP